MKYLIAVLVLLMLSNDDCWAIEEYSCVAEKVYDGDSITKCLDDNSEYHNVRLAGLDAPEKRQTYGILSKEALSNKILGYKISVKKIATDRYQRDISIVTFKGENINEFMVKNGHAWSYLPQPEYNADYTVLEFMAKDQNKGLWSYSQNPIAPSDYRKGVR